MKNFLFSILTVILCLSLFACSVGEIPDIEYSSRIKIFSGSMGQAVVSDDEKTVKSITDAVNALETTTKSHEKIDGYKFELQWLDENGSVIETLRVYGKDEIGYGNWIYEADCGELLEILSGVPMPLSE